MPQSKRLIDFVVDRPGSLTVLVSMSSLQQKPLVSQRQSKPKPKRRWVSFVKNCSIVVGGSVLTVGSAVVWHVWESERSNSQIAIIRQPFAVSDVWRGLTQLDAPDAPGFCGMLGGETGARASCIIISRSMIRVGAYQAGLKTRACATQGRYLRIAISLCAATAQGARGRLCSWLNEQQAIIDKTCG